MRFLIAALLIFLGGAALAERRVALVIGNGAYQTVEPLKNPENDAKAMADALRRLNFEVIEGIDEPREGMHRSVIAFREALKGADLALFYFAGHGLQVAGRNYLIPTDALLEHEYDVQWSTIPLDIVMGEMERSGAARLVLLDACRDNPFEDQLARSLGKTRAAVTLGQGLASVEPTRGAYLGFATGPGQTADDGRGVNSPFTTALLKHIETPGLEFNSMMKRVRADVLEMTNDKQLTYSRDTLRTEVILVPAAAPAPEPKPEPAPKPAPVFDPRLMELSAWEAIKDSDNAGDFAAFIEAFPEGVLRPVAESRLAALSAPEPVEQEEETLPPAVMADVSGPEGQAPLGESDTGPEVVAAAPEEDHTGEIELWASIQFSTDAADFEAYLEAYPDGMLRPLAEARLAALQAAPAAEPAAPVAPPVAKPAEPPSEIDETDALRAQLAVTDLASLARGEPEGLYQAAVAWGAELYAANCVECHGPSGAGGAKGSGNPTLADDDWLWGGSIDEIAFSIKHGIRSELSPYTRWSEMPAFGRDAILNGREIVYVGQYVRSLSGLAHDRAFAQQGEAVFLNNCAVCHGDDGSGQTLMGAPNLTDDIWLYGGDVAAITETVSNARFGVMPAYLDEHRSEGGLDAQAINALALYVHGLDGSVTLAALPSTTPEPAPCPQCPATVAIPGGATVLGSNSGSATAAERPTVAQTIAPFRMSVAEITVGEIRAYETATGRSIPRGCYIWTADGKLRQRSNAYWGAPGFDVTDASPAACLNWDDAAAYARWLNEVDPAGGWRLPSEAEFEYATRAGSTGDYYWGAVAGACAAVNGADAGSRFKWRNKACNDGYETPVPAGTFPPNAYGLDAMIGNLWEWTADCWNKTNAGAPADGSARTTGYCPSRVLRGASWDDPVENLRSSYRVAIPKGQRQANVGFRLVQDPQ